MPIKDEQERKRYHARYHADYYQRNKKRYNQNAYKNRIRYRARNKKYVEDWLRSHPCVDCKEDDIIVLEFDHVRGTKHADVSNMVFRSVSLERIKAEIAKCDVRCANCHKRVTHKRKMSP